MSLADLHPLAERQAGYFSAAQARAEVGWGPQHLTYHLGRGNIERLMRGIYRLAYYPRAEDEELLVVWLWSKQQAVFSHQTALTLHGLSDLLLNRLHVTVPSRWSSRRLRWPGRVVPHFADLDAEEIEWVGHVPATSAVRAINDCAQAGTRPAEVQKAISEGLVAGLFAESQVAPAAQLLEELLNAR